MGELLPPLWVIASDGERFIGQRAKHQAIMNPESTFYAVNRFIGRKYDEVTDAASKVSYQVLPDSNGKVKFHCLMQILMLCKLIDFLTEGKVDGGRQK